MNVISVNAKWCKSCRLCIEYCPRKVFDFPARAVAAPARPGDCDGCGLCELKCPEMAISMEVTRE